MWKVGIINYDIRSVKWSNHRPYEERFEEVQGVVDLCGVFSIWSLEPMLGSLLRSMYRCMENIDHFYSNIGSCPLADCVCDISTSAEGQLVLRN